MGPETLPIATAALQEPLGVLACLFVRYVCRVGGLLYRNGRQEEERKGIKKENS